MRSESFLSGSFPTAPSADQAIARLAEHQHGLITTAQLARIGLDTAAVSKRARAGRLQRRYRGVYSVGPLSREGELMAAVLAAGPGALLSHWAAAELLGLTPYRASLIDVIVPRKRRSPPGTRYRRASIHWRDVTDRKGIPVTSVARLLVDLTDAVHVPHEITAVIRQAAYHGRATDRRDDAALDAKLRSAGYEVIRARTPEEVVDASGHGSERRPASVLVRALYRPGACLRAGAWSPPTPRRPVRTSCCG